MESELVFFAVPRTVRFWGVEVTFLTDRLDVVVVLFVEVFEDFVVDFVLFAFAFGVVVVFFGVCFFDFDCAVFLGLPGDFVTFFPSESLKKLSRDFDVEVFRAGILLNQ